MRLIAVDIQPAYENYIGFSIHNLTEWIKYKKFDNILWLYNGPDMGFEDEETIKFWLYEHSEFSEEENEYEMEKENIAFFEKGYAFLGELMGKISDEDIIEIGKYMIEKDIHDTRDFSEEDIEYLSKVKGIDEENIVDKNWCSIYITDVFDILKEYKGDDIMLIGGGENECLLEIELVLGILEITYKKENKFIY